MLTHRGLADLRRAATLSHMCPTVCTRLRVDDTTLVEVRSGPSPAPAGLLVVHPCAFRMRVAEAWAHQREGRQLRMLDFPDDPTVDVVPFAGGATWPGGILRVPLTDHHGYVVTTMLEASAAERAAGDWLAQVESLATVGDVGLLGDLDTQVSVVHVDAVPSLDPPQERQLVDLLEQAVASFAAAELLADLELAEPA